VIRKSYLENLKNKEKYIKRVGRAKKTTSKYTGITTASSATGIINSKSTGKGITKR
jgi:hypothetical protein